MVTDRAALLGEQGILQVLQLMEHVSLESRPENRSPTVELSITVTGQPLPHKCPAVNQVWC